MTLVRVYCGLASADNSAFGNDPQNWLTVSIVDDAGRLLDICEITDDPGGYAELCALFAQRGEGPAAVAVATACNDHAVTRLLTAAGRYIALSHPDEADDLAERFADDASADEIRSGPAERRAIGLARALQAGVLSAVPQATPPDMVCIKPLLTAHAAIVTGRQQAAGTLREVLRELYPAALRAYADPAEPVSLAVLQALPEPGQLVSGAAGRSREGDVVGSLVEAGVAEREILEEAVTALRVAVSETPRRPGITRAMTSAVAETVRQAVASVRCFDAASDALVGVIADRMVPEQGYDTFEPAPLRVVSNGNGTPRAAEISFAKPDAPRAELDDERSQATTVLPRRTPAGSPAAAAGPSTVPTAIPPSTRQSRPAFGQDPATTGGLPAFSSDRHTFAGQPERHTFAGQPDLPPVPPVQPARPAASNDSRNGQPQFGTRSYDSPAEPAHHSAPPMPAQRPSPEVAVPGSRSTWPNLGEQERSGAFPTVPGPLVSGAGAADVPRQREGRVRPPWQDELPVEPPTLRLVEPAPMPDPLLSQPRQPIADLRGEPPTLRLVQSEPERYSSSPLDESSPISISTDDSDLLIFSACQSAWFTDGAETEEKLDWAGAADVGWQAASQAARPATGEETMAGLPRRVPQQNLVPGSPQTPAEEPERPLRIVRDAAAIAAHTSGYFSGYRRGQEVGGYSVGGRPGRESSVGWDFSRDPAGDEDYTPEYRSSARGR